MDRSPSRPSAADRRRARRGLALLLLGLALAALLGAVATPDAASARSAMAPPGREAIFHTNGGSCRTILCGLPDDPLAPRQWALRSTSAPDGTGGIGALLAWRLQPGTPATRIAVVDTGVDASHPDLAGRLAASWTLPGNPQRDAIGHGTAVATVAAATAGNGIGIAGVAPHAGIVAVKATDDRWGPTDEMDCSALADAVGAAVAAGAQVVNVSASGPWSCRLLDEAVARAWDAGALVVAAAGNENRSAPEYPAALPHVVAVAATDPGDTRAPFSTYGRWVELAAPGVGILAAVPTGGSELGRDYALLDGTSFAAPLVAGAAALAWPAVADADGDGRVNDDVRARLLESAAAIPGTGRLWQAGRLDACRAVAGAAARVSRASRNAAQTSPRCAPRRDAPRPERRRAARARRQR